MHTHTTFCDGKHSPEENVLAAIGGGLVTLGFSSHAPYGEHDTEDCLSRENIRAYRDEIRRIQKKYSDRIEVLLGIEQDYFSPELEEQYDYIIGSVHYVKKDNAFIPVDYSFDRLKTGIELYFSSDAKALCREYYRTVADIVNKTSCDIIGHFDLVSKFNEKHPVFDEDDRSYRGAALEAVDALLESDRLFEVNTGAMFKALRSCPYPAPFIVKRIADKNGRFIITSDAHDAGALTFGFSETVEYLKALGVPETWVFRNGELQAVSL